MSQKHRASQVCPRTPASPPGNRRVVSGAVTSVLLALLLAAPAAAQTYVKWNQPPDPANPDNLYLGWNENSNWWDEGQTAADDWVCTTADPVVMIRWWGSYSGWRSAAEPPDPPSHFHILFWTDVPADPNVAGSFSHPGQVVHEILCYNYQSKFVGWEFDPRVVGSLKACFQFEQYLTPEEYFYQDPSGSETVYWISISACWNAMPPPRSWGWETRPRDTDSPAPDDAVVIEDPRMPGLGSQYVSGYPLEYPSGTSWDLAFELYTETQSTLKWSQTPDLQPTGIDVMTVYEAGAAALADDFQCTQFGPVTQISIWGSWWHDVYPVGDPANVGFGLGIYDDIPAGPTGSFSSPGNLLWYRYFDPGEFQVFEQATNLNEGWLIVPDGYQENADWTCWQYTFDLDLAEFVQRGSPSNPRVYWLGLQSSPIDDNAYFGWKTSEQHWNDASVYAFGLFPGLGPWTDLYYPSGHPYAGDQIDLAFEIAGSDLTPKWSQPPEPYVPDDAYNGWNEESVYFGDQIVADDWVCQNGDPLTDVHWWGSFIGWGSPIPPTPLPSRFHIHIWTDVPANPPDEPYSHPGEVIYEHLCDDYTWRFAGWDIDPRDPNAPPEPCFYFECDLPEAEWFYQDPSGDPTIYWVSISADYDGVVPDYPWGWKSRPRDPESPAPDDAVRILEPTWPVVGSLYGFGEPIYWPDEEDSWDMAFQLTARPRGLETKWEQDPYPPGSGFDAVSNLWWPDLEPPEEVDVVVADDFVSDGRDILAVSWWGSFYDDRYYPTNPPIEPYVLDGWLIGIHWAHDDTPSCPPDIAFDPPPTVLAVYFAPAEAVNIACIWGVDCLGHPMCSYSVNLDACCLVCTHPDPRAGMPPYPPGCEGAFQERADVRYWLSVQAVTGVEWVPPDCPQTFTGHLPPLDVDPLGRFWGWHNGYEPPPPPMLDQACAGQIADITPYPPSCWDYGFWATQAWLCDTPPEPVNMAFALSASNCPEDLNGNGRVDLADLATLLAVYNTCWGAAGFLPAADFNNDGCINLSDLAQLLSVYGRNCPTR